MSCFPLTIEIIVLYRYRGLGFMTISGVNLARFSYSSPLHLVIEGSALGILFLFLFSGSCFWIGKLFYHIVF